jgi:hypothetical protein
MIPLQMVPLLETPVAALPALAPAASPATGSAVAAEPLAASAVASAPARRADRKPRCEDCFFHRNMLCALPDKKPCPTFRPAHPDGLRPPRQLSFAFRQERRTEPFFFQLADA